MQTIANVATADAYSNALTVEDDSADTLVFLIGNASVIARFRTPSKQGGAREDYGPEVLLTPQTNTVRNVNGAQFRSAVAGVPATIVAQLIGPNDPQLAGGTPFTGQIQASGQVTNAVLQLLGVNPVTADLALTVANQDLAGGAINFTVSGSNARLFFSAVFDVNVTGAGIGFAFGIVVLDGNPLGPYVLVGDYLHRDAYSCSGVVGVGAGAHTVKLQGRKSAAGGVASIVETAGVTGLALVVQDA